MAGEGDAERLVVLLEARVKDFEKNMAKASGTADRNYSKMRRGSRTATHNMERDMLRSTSRINGALATTSTKIGVFAKAGLGGLAAGAIATLGPLLAVTSAIRGAKEALTEFDAIGKSAKATGLNAETFQELAYAAELGGVKTDQFAKAMETFAKNTGLAAAGQGRLITQLKALNPELLKNLQLAQSQEERLRIVADALDREADASKKAAIASALFGDSGARMVEVLKGGSSALEDTARKARALGIVIDNSLIARAETLNDQFSTAQKVIDLQFKQALIELVPVIMGTAQAIGVLARSINVTVDQMRSLDQRVFIRPLQNQLIAIQNQRALLSMDVQKSKEFIEALGENNPSAAFEAVSVAGKEAEMERLMQSALKLQDRIIELQKQDTGTLNLPDVPTIDLPPGGDRKDQIKTVHDLIAGLEMEREALGLSAVEQEKLAALRQAGAAATDEQKQKIEELVQSIADEQAHLEIVAANQTPGDLFQVEMERMDDLLERGIISWEEYTAAVERARGKVTLDTGAMVGQVGNIMGSLTSILESSGAEQFEIVKALSVATAVLKGYEAITSAYAAGAAIPGGGPFTGQLYAAAAAAATGAQIAAIASTTKSSTSMSGAGASSSAPAIAAPVQSGPTVNVELRGNSFSATDIEQLFSDINEGLGRDMKLNVQV